MKDVLIAGDTLDNSYTVAGFPADEGWTLVLRLLPAVAGPAPILLTAVPFEVHGYRVQVGPPVTQFWAAGDYTLTRWVEKPGARYTVETEPELPILVHILPNPATATVYDGRSPSRQALDAALAFRSGSTSLAIKEYEINGRRLVYFSSAELLVEINRLKAEVANEERRAKLAAGLANPRHLYISFGRS